MIVLIVDDSKLARIVMKRAIANLRPSWVFAEAANFEDAMLAVEEVIPDLAVIDYNMPGRNGLDLAEELLAKWPHLFVILATANVQNHIKDQTREIGASFVSKPLTEEKLGLILPQQI